MRTSRRSLLALVVAALASLAIGGCAHSGVGTPIAFADANPTGPCPPKICHNPQPTYSYSPEPSGSQSTEPPPSSNSPGPRPTGTRRPTASGSAPGTIATGTSGVPTGPAVTAPSGTKSGFVGVFAFGPEPPPPPLPLDPPPPPSPLQTALPFALVGVAAALALAAFFAIVRTVRSPASGLKAGATPAKG